jgi:sulfur carrier protein ThiS adenylyltransferase
MTTMTIFLNERPVVVPRDSRLFAIKALYKPDADVMVVNGGIVTEDRILAEGDAVVLIKRGEIPEQAELEALMVARHSPGVHRAVKQATVGIAGLGGLGSAVAVALARLGVGRLVLADFDVVEPSNLNRQQYFIDQLGKYKTEALKENLQRINPYVSYETHTVLLSPANVPVIFADCAVLVEAFDQAAMKAMLVETWLKHFPTRPIVAASGLAGHAGSNRVRTHRLGRSLYLVGDLETAAQPGTGLMAPRVGVAAHHQANAVLRLLLGEDPTEG